MKKIEVMLGVLGLMWGTLWGCRGAVAPTAPVFDAVDTVSPTPLVSMIPQSFRAEHIQIQEIRQIAVVPELEGREARFMSWSPDGNRFLFAVETDKPSNIPGVVNNLFSLWQANADGSAPRMLAEEGYSGVWSPDGQKIVYYTHIEGKSRKTNVWVMNANGDARIKLGTQDANTIDWLDENTVMFIHEGAIHLVDDQRYNFRTLDLGIANQVTPHRFFISPNRQYIALMSDDLWLAQIKDETLINTKAYKKICDRIVWSQDSTKLLVMGANVSPRVVDTNANIVTELNLPVAWLGAVTWSPDGEVIAFNAPPVNCYEPDEWKPLSIYKVNVDGSGFSALLNSPSGVVAPNWSPNGTHIALERYGDVTQVEIMTIATQR